MPFDKDGLEGTGTLKEYFNHPVSDEDFESMYGKEWSKQIKDRNSAIDRLCLELFSDLSGLSPDTEIRALWPENGYYDEENYRINKRALRNAKRRKGYNLIGWQMDDPIISLWHDGRPIAAFYASYRGAYIAGGYVVITGQGYAATNLASEPELQNTWAEFSNGCTKVAYDFLMNPRARYF